MADKKTLCVDVFAASCAAARDGVLIHRASKQDKEFHFQNWFSERLDGLHCKYDEPARNTYPNFRLVELTECCSVKGLAYPGREANYDSNSQVPTGHHNARPLYSFFGPHPQASADDDPPVIVLSICPVPSF